MKKLKTLFGAVGLFFLTFGQAQSAVIWDWDGSNLLGAQNVVVGTNVYDVRFSDGSCAQLLDGCNDIADFAFITTEEGSLASAALLDQVLIDDGGAPAPFDSIPYTVNGCEAQWVLPNGEIGGDTDHCRVITPTYFSTSGFHKFPSAYNSPDLDGVQIVQGLSLHTNYSGNGFVNSRSTFAIWTPSAEVPLPATVWLLGIGFSGLLRFNRALSLNLRNRSF